MNFITKLKLKNFKRFCSFEVDFNDNINILVGDNESGKSSLIEAINLVLSGSRNKVETIGLENIFNSEHPNFYKKVAKGFELLNIELNDSISFENLEVKYAEAKWLQAINETEKAERIFSFIESLEIQDYRLRFVHASRLRLAQIKFKKGLTDEALNLLYKVNDKERLRFSPDVYYDSGFDYNRTEASVRLINHIKKTEK